ncbi:MAG: hypothetical protein HBSAPP03_00940 [Phycisphaerae bacterium]|nr:MAG: hypothetical protein HBSAPP03_00940 [Phycisphaerae bacterium]
MNADPAMPDAASTPRVVDRPAPDGTVHNPDFALSHELARAEWRRMRTDHRSLPRPVLVLDGWHSPGITAWGLARRLCKLTSGRWSDFAWATYPLAMSVDAAARQAMRVVEHRGLSGREIDLVGISMGGIVARAITSGVLGLGGPEVVRAVRVFTLVSPHRGARLAAKVRLDRASEQLRPGSDLLRRLDEAFPARTYDLTCLALRRDWLVGEENTAPFGMEPYWLDPVGFVPRMLSHFASIYDRRLQVEIARRLRGEPPFATRASPPPVQPARRSSSSSP